MSPAKEDCPLKLAYDEIKCCILPPEPWLKVPWRIPKKNQDQSRLQLTIPAQDKVDTPQSGDHFLTKENRI